MLDNTFEIDTFDNRFAADSKLYVVFHMVAVQNGFRSEQEGRPIFDDIPHCRIHVPGDKTTIVDEPVSAEHQQRFPRQWEAFQKNMEQSPEGTPLEQWPQLTISQVHEFKAVNVMTVEQLAGMTDANAQRFMGGYELRRKAETFLKVAKDSAEAQRLATANAELETRLVTQESTIKEQSDAIKHLMARVDELASKGKKAA